MTAHPNGRIPIAYAVNPPPAPLLCQQRLYEGILHRVKPLAGHPLQLLLELYCALEDFKYKRGRFGAVVVEGGANVHPQLCESQTRPPFAE
jgi:hypothetical protein